MVINEGPFVLNVPTSFHRPTSLSPRRFHIPDLQCLQTPVSYNFSQLQSHTHIGNTPKGRLKKDAKRF